MVPVASESPVDGTLPFRACGDTDADAAVRGLSAEPFGIAAWEEEEGSLPVNSSFRIRDLRSSNSFQTVEVASVDTVDSVPS